MQASRFDQLLKRDWFQWIQATLVDPTLDSIEVEDRHFNREASRTQVLSVHVSEEIDLGSSSNTLPKTVNALVCKPPLALHNLHWCLAALKSPRNLSMLLLALMASSRGLPLA